MAELPTSPLSPVQVSILKRLLKAGFKFVTFERYARYIGVEKDGFIALLDPTAGKLTLFSQVGYRLGDGIGMLVEQNKVKAFVFHAESIPATADLLAAYQRFKSELNTLLEPLE